jgi:hypothetical protein
MNKVTICLNPFETGIRNDASYEVEDVRAFLATQWTVWPQHAAIYHGEHDVTPTDEAGVERLGELTGEFTVICWPGDPVTILYVAFAAFAVATVYFLSNLPSIPAARNQQAGSPNNELSQRTNRARPNGRIPDIFGEQISTPDLIALPYTFYVDHEEIEHSYMCIGRGEYLIDEDDIKDGATRVNEIDGCALEVFGPNTSPNSGTAELSIGVIEEPLLIVQKCEAVNGQVLLASNEAALSSSSAFRFVAPNKIENNGTVDFVAAGFTVGGSVIITTGDRHEGREDPALPSGENFFLMSFNLSGTFDISAVTSTLITLDDPASVSDAWGEDVHTGFAYDWAVPHYVDGTYGWTPMTLEVDSGIGSVWIGPYTVDMTSMRNFIVNVVNPQGMYKDDGTAQISTSVEVQLGVTRVDASGTPIADESFYNATIEGSATLRTQRAITIRAPDDATLGRCKFRMRRITPRDNAYTGQVSDEVRWKDLYGTCPVSQEHFGDVTTVRTLTHATSGALAVKERRLNAKVIRKIKTVTATSTTHTFSVLNEATTRCSDILIHMCLDPYIGNRTENEIYFYNIIQAADAVEAYFGTDTAAMFNYTFDKDNISFEESLAAVAGACFCTSYRRGNVITMDFERTTTASKLSFNHRNKIPGSERRTITFGTEGDVDGIEYEYVSPTDQAPLTYYIPTDRSAVNPKRVTSIGVRHPLQAYFQAWRIYNKLIKQRIAVEFEATQEAELLVRNDRILVADNTRPDTQDGEVRGLTGLVITTSQPVEFLAGHDYNVFLQLTDGTVQSIAATAGANAYEITLDEAPTLALSLNPSNFALSTYILAASDDPRALAFLVTERLPAGRQNQRVQAVNYDAAYYANDQNYADGFVDINGNPLLATGLSFSGGTVTLHDDGTVTRAGGTSSFDAYWSSVSAPTTDIGNSFWVRATKTSISGSRTFAPSGWQSLSDDVTFSVTGGAGSVSGIVEIASDPSGYNIVATDSLSCSNAL